MIVFKDVQHIRETILKKGLSYSDFAIKVGMSRGNLWKAFDKGSVSPKNAKKIAEALSIEFDDIFLIKMRSKEHKRQNVI